MTQASGFGQFVPGFDFLQNLAGQAASGAAQGFGQGLPPWPQLSSWVTPTFNVEELDKRIGELRAVHFWLDQNAKALAATIQALEVQKMTLATLQTMNVSLGDVADALQVKPADAAADAGAPAGKTPFAGLDVPERTYGQADTRPAGRRKAAPRKAAAQPAAQAATGGAAVVDPMQWWGALSQQFQQIASQAMQDAAQTATPGRATDAPVSGRGQAAARKGRAPSSPTPAKTRTATRRRSP